MRCAIYTRVSSEDQVQGFSLDAQLRACRDYATAQKWSIAAEYVDEGVSAYTDRIAKRPQFARMLDDAARKAFDVVVVHKLDRFARNRRVAFDALDRLAKNGVSFVSITENVDFSTPWGSAIQGVFFVFAQFYAANLGHEVSKGKQERKRQGLFNVLPYGVAKGENNAAVPDRTQLPNGSTPYDALLLIFRRAAAGDGTGAIAGALNRLGYRARRGKLWGRTSVNYVIRNHFYIGELPAKSKNRPLQGATWLPAKHGPVIDPMLFDAAQRATDDNRLWWRPASVRHDAPVYSLTGLLRCGHCGSPMRVGAKERYVYAYCGGRWDVGNDCPQRYVQLSIYEAQVAEWLGRLRITAEHIARAQSKQAQGDDNEAQRRGLQESIGRLKELYILGDLSMVEYQARKAVIESELARLAPLSNNSLEAIADTLGDDPIEKWESLAQRERNSIARLLFEELVVRDRSIVTFRVRGVVKWLLSPRA